MGDTSNFSAVDSVTGLITFSEFCILAQDELNSPELKNEIAFIFFNIENFRSYNQKYGIREGDNCLRTVGQILEALFPQEICARISGDHFVVVADRAEIEDKIIKTCDEIRPFRRDTQIQLSAGIYLPKENDVDVSLCVDRAKMACDSIRNHYDSRLAYYDEESDKIFHREHFILSQFDNALKKEYIQPFYQPVIRSLSGCVCEYEALARWVDPEHGMISPGDFVPALEKYHLIRRMDLAIIDRVCKDKKKIKEANGHLIPVSVNLSQLDLAEGDIVRDVDGIIKKYDIDPWQIHIEITESVFGIDSKHIHDIIEDFRSLGYEVWMDDFGSGYSSLNSLKTFSFNTLKLDMKFILGFDKSDRSKDIIESIVDMTKKLGIATVAEGVETIEAAEYLKHIGVDMLQGFYYSRPLSLDDCMKLGMKLESHNSSKYYNDISKVNLLSAQNAELVNESVADINDNAIALVECGSQKLVHLNYSDSYIRFLEKAGIKTIEEADKFINKSHGKLPSVFYNSIKMAHDTKKPKTFDVSKNNQTLSFRVIPVASVGSKIAVIMQCFNISKHKQLQRNIEQEEIRSFIFAQFNRVVLLDKENNYLEDVFTNVYSYKATRKSKGCKNVINECAQNNIHPEDKERFKNYFDLDSMEDRLMRTSKRCITDYFRTKNIKGKYEWQEYVVVLVENENKKLFLVCITNVDIERIRLLKEIDKESYDMPSSQVFLWLASRAHAQILGYSSYEEFINTAIYFDVNLTQNTIDNMHLAENNQIFGRDFNDLKNDYDKMIESFISLTVNLQDIQNITLFYDRQKLIREFENGNEIGQIEYKSYGDQGPRWVHAIYQLIKVTDTDEIYAYFLVYNVDSYKKKLLSDQRAAEIDSLTGIYNRYSAVPKIRDYLHKNENSQCALVMMDLDHFKNINDTYGHECGDEMLAAFAGRLEAAFGMYGFACRLGGDEFLGFIKDRSKDFVNDFLTDFMKKPISINYAGKNITCNMSAGFVMFPEQGQGYHDLYRKADEALYEAKLTGRNKFCIYDENKDKNND